MKNFIEAAQYAFAALGGALGAVMGGFDGFLYALVVFVIVDYATGLMAAAVEKNPHLSTPPPGSVATLHIQPIPADIRTV